ncbi:MAG TPA: hypothetical protein VFN19_00050 [Candidatus Nanopelagicales bacterium]|jgi:hypothetical protein|nr:hypothetical protein [Candidatus Nanopelagicales bacterium]
MDTTARTIPTPAVLATAPAFDRFRWEQAVLSSHVHLNARMVALVLAHCAGTAGYLPPDGPQRVGRIAERARLTIRQVRVSLTQLEYAGLISRPDLEAWPLKKVVRPLTLTMPRPRPASPEPNPEEAEG